MTETKPASATPLTDKAMAKLRALVDGNGIDPKKIEMLGSDEKKITLKGQMLLSVDVLSTRQRFPGAHGVTKGAQQVATVEAIAQRVEAMKTKLREGDQWTKEVVEQLKDTPGSGIALVQAEITLDRLQEMFTATETCAPCHGKGSLMCTACQGAARVPCKACNAVGEELCPHCQGTGKNPMAQPRTCLQCRGSGNISIPIQQSCPNCHGGGREPSHHEQACHVCHGGGRVQGQQQQTCQVCYGRGVIQPAQSEITCQVCQGHMRIVCRTCAGQKQIECPTCVGKGSVSCNTCHGDGKFTVEETAMPVARCEFHIIENAELPSTLRHAIDRGGMKMLIKLGAAITMGAVDINEKKIAVIPYDAEFPFAEARLKIAGRPMRAGIIGEKAAIRDIPPFFDPVFDGELKKLEKNLGNSGVLKKAFKLRALRELFTQMQIGGDVLLNFRRQYPYGFSQGMIERMQALLLKMAEASTFVARGSAAGGMMLILCGIYFAIIESGVRLQIAEKTSPILSYVFDALVCGASFAAVIFALRFAASVHLRSITGRATTVSMRAQHAGSLGLGMGGCAVLIYLGLLWFLKATPVFIG